MLYSLWSHPSSYLLLTLSIGCFTAVHTAFLACTFWVFVQPSLYSPLLTAIRRLVCGLLRLGSVRRVFSSASYFIDASASRVRCEWEQMDGGGHGARRFAHRRSLTPVTRHLPGGHNPGCSSHAPAPFNCLVKSSASGSPAPVLRSSWPD